MKRPIEVSLKKKIDLYNMTEKEAIVVIEASTFLNIEEPMQVFNKKYVVTKSGQPEYRYSVKNFDQYMLLKKDLE